MNSPVFASHNLLPAGKNPDKTIRYHYGILFAGCCGGKKAKMEVNPKPSAIQQPSKADTIEKSACPEIKKALPESLNALPKQLESIEKKNFLRNLKARVTAWFQQFFRILKTDFKALFIGNESRKQSGQRSCS